MYDFINQDNLKELAQSESNLLRNYKDSVFRMLFNNEKNALELYNALSGKKVSTETSIQFTTLKEVIYKTRKNDISFLLDNVFIILFEHQSTLNDNMSTRDLIYYTTTVQRMFANKAFYKESKVIIPRPEFIILYNGTENIEDFSTLNLSDNFAGEGEINLQLTVKVYNINEGRNPEIMRNCKILEQYSRFVSIVREATQKDELTDKELQAIFQNCIDHGILPDFLTQYGTEVISMLFEELTEEEARELAREDGYAIGHREGIERLNRLINILLSEGRADALERAANDSEYQNTLFEEYGI